MNSSAKSLKTPLKWSAFIVLSVVAFVSSYSYYTWTNLQPVTAPEEVGVSIGYDPATKMMAVTMDGKTEMISITNAENSAFYKQATKRVALRGIAKFQQRQTSVWWLPMIGRWLVFELVLVLFISRI